MLKLEIHIPAQAADKSPVLDALTITISLLGLAAAAVYLLFI